MNGAKARERKLHRNVIEMKVKQSCGPIKCDEETYALHWTLTGKQYNLQRKLDLIYTH